MKVEDAAVRYELDEDDSYYDDDGTATQEDDGVAEGATTGGGDGGSGGGNDDTTADLMGVEVRMSQIALADGRLGLGSTTMYVLEPTVLPGLRVQPRQGSPRWYS